MNIKAYYEKIGFPRLIIAAFLIVLLITSFILDVEQGSLWQSILIRFGMNAILVLAMVPGIRCGIGINFNLALGVVIGLFCALVSIQFQLEGARGFFLAIFLAIPVAAVAGYIYAQMLNRIKGQEMTVGTYLGFSLVSVMCIVWLVAPFSSPELIWPMSGSGLRTTILMDSSFGHFLNKLWSFNVSETFRFPTGLMLFFALCAIIVYLFNNTKAGNAMKVSGDNEQFAISNGLNVNNYRVLGVMLSTVLSAIGIIVYSQAFGFIQLYTAPLFVAMPAAASILIGGASLKNAKIIHVIIGTFLFQSLLVVALPVINIISEGQMAEVVRIIISNGIIIYALTRGGDTQ